MTSGTHDKKSLELVPAPETEPPPVSPRDPAVSLEGCLRVVIVGRTGSGKTSLARELARALGVPHVELDSLYFNHDLSTVPLSLLRTRTAEAISPERWVTDGNKSTVRDLVWPRADTLVWLDFPLAVSVWRLLKRARQRTTALHSIASDPKGEERLTTMMLAALRGVLTALRSHRGQRREYPRLLARPENEHLAVVRLRSPRAARHWLARVRESAA